ncbi:MAG TPA: DUF542 domain-containing protein [Solirubrobacterales bacterium]|nr:DUF542 domain-containing protein [Solirubrobacterales bacterium]
MSAIDPEQPIGTMVVQQPGLARVFEELGFDYCCGGQASLSDVAAQRGLDARTLAIALEADARANAPGAGERDWSEESFAALCDHIVSEHHAYLRRELPRIDGLLEKVVSRHGETVPSLNQLQREFAALHVDLLDHIDHEEEYLFPLCRDLAGDGQLNPEALPQLGMHEASHAGVGEALARMRELAGGYDLAEALCTTHGVMLESLHALELDLHQHIHEENNVLFPRLRGELGGASQPVAG